MKVRVTATEIIRYSKVVDMTEDEFDEFQNDLEDFGTDIVGDMMSKGDIQDGEWEDVEAWRDD